MGSRSARVMVVAFALLAPAAFGQVSARAAKIAVTAPPKYTPPKTPWGDPDLQGIFTSDDSWGVPFERPKQFGTRATLTEDEVAAREKRIDETITNVVEEGNRPTLGLGGGPRQAGVDGAPVPSHWGEFARRASRQTSLIIDPPDGRLPPLTEEAQKRLAAQRAQRAKRPDSWLDRSLYDRCITRGVAGSALPVIYGNGSQIIQAPGWVAIRYEMVHETRLIPLDGRPHAPANVRSYMGDSRGHWEGNTLVVETTNFLDNTTSVSVNGSTGPPASDELKLVERFTRVAPDAVQYSMTVYDPKTYTAPWTVSFPITQEPGYQLFEYACHEGNYAMRNLLSAARAEDKADAEKAGKK
jgi:hypothetical protein